MNTIVILFSCIAAAACIDIQAGARYGRKIFDERIQASPALWKQIQIVNINATEDGVISQVNVTDNRLDKDGEAKIVKGGVGEKNVSIELKSPSVFRGFDFHVVVYSEQENVQHPGLTKDIDVNTQVKTESNDSVTEDINPTVPSKHDDKVVENKGEPNAPATTVDQTRKYRNTEHEQATVDPIAQYVKEDKTTAMPEQTAETTTVDTQKATTNIPELTTVTEVKTNGPINPAIASHVDVKTKDATTQNPHGDTQNFQVPQVLTKDVTVDSQVHDAKEVSTTAYISTEMSTESVPAKYAQYVANTQNYDEISKELGQKIVFGIKRY